MTLGEVTLRASFGAALAVLGAVGAIAAGSHAASASAADTPTDTFTVVSAGASSANPDQLTVVLDSPSTIAGLAAWFMADGGSQYDTSLTPGSAAPDPTDPTQTETTWTADIPVGASGLPLGSYAITLVGTFDDTSNYSLDNAGSFSAPVLSLTVKPVTETYGKPVTVTGTLNYTAGSASTPDAGQQVWVNTTQDSAGALAKATTTASGGFSITLPERAAGGTLYVGSAGTADLAGVVTPLALKVVHPTVISSFKASLSEGWRLSVSGCLGFPAGDKTERIAHTTGLTVQYASPGGSWKKLGVISASESDQVCGTGGIKFSGSFAAPENYADYRVVYAGTTGVTSYSAKTGGAVLAWRYADRITGFKVSPTVVNAGGKLTIKGTLQYYYSGWHNYGAQTIVVYLHPQGSNPTWYWLVKVKTNSKGQFSTTFKDPVSATWQAVFAGNNSKGVGHLSTGSSEVYVRLK
jgi:hypothetical protein